MPIADWRAGIAELGCKYDVSHFIQIGNWQSEIGNDLMDNFLSRFIGKRVDIYCGGSASLRGDVIKVEGGVLHLRDADGKSCYVAIDKIVVVWEARDDTHRAGFMPAPNKD